ncbi:methyltransferase family protein [Pseudoalteromonas luteoviolacea]|uniref:Steroid 5-alpha reductase C-terminal domain-containing protein n=1 Tax=Pseudoalteromonas luteoviolacea S4060-1 TaxID=1365257 RepID=A0A162C2U6_9GAMM|nr:isoprenylcysteine carboxylmethyltransferase family protein [Pseudoalteromonas luteoviolacea]KZN61304.1 hypothetical protein N478_04365 [Pseudoalteromonas luteoviolacea S4060-1]
MQKLLPPILFMLTLVTMSLTCWWFELPHYLLFPLNLIGLPFAFAGLMLSVRAKRQFIRADTNVMTFGEPNKLVVEGVFKYTRNPMYLGFVISLLGFYLLLGANELTLGFVVLFVLVSDRWYIRFEERVMLEKFAEQYQAYCRNVRRWV